jgi:hypothetical protein
LSSCGEVIIVLSLNTDDQLGKNQNLEVLEFGRKYFYKSIMYEPRGPGTAGILE